MDKDNFAEFDNANESDFKFKGLDRVGFSTLEIEKEVKILSSRVRDVVDILDRILHEIKKL